MIRFVAHKFNGDLNNLERAKKVTHDLQVKDLANCYICPLLAFSHFELGSIGIDNEMELSLDILSEADCLIVASDISKSVERFIGFAKLVKMEVFRLDQNGDLQPFTE